MTIREIPANNRRNDGAGEYGCSMTNGQNNEGARKLDADIFPFLAYNKNLCYIANIRLSAKKEGALQ